MQMFIASRFVPPLLASLIWIGGMHFAQAEVKVTASIKPVHSLVAAVMGKTGTPALLIRGSASPHGFSLQPSQARQLQSSDVVFWIGHSLESFLEKPLGSIAGKAVSVELGEVPGLHQIHIDEKHDDHGHGSTDPHIWLDPKNAIAMVNQIAGTMSEADPANAVEYNTNADNLIAGLGELPWRLKAKLDPVKNRPFIVFHDAFSHLQHRFRLNVVDSFVDDPDRQISAAKLAKIRQAIKDHNIRCIFTEPQFNPKSVDVAIEGTQAEAVTVDVLGANLEAGPNLYFNLMEDLTDTVAGCLSG